MLDSDKTIDNKTKSKFTCKKGFYQATKLENIARDF